MKEYRNYYFKDTPEGVTFMSGIRLPKNADGIVYGYKFSNCTFHPNCGNVKFENCEFVDCSGDEYIKKA